MSLQDLELSPFLASELYRDTLVAIKTGEILEEAPITKKTQPNAYVAANISAIGLPPVTATPPESAAQPFKEATAEKPIAPVYNEPIVKPRETEAGTRLFNEPIKTQEQPNTSTRIKFLGGNKKKIAFIVNCSTDVFLPEKHLDWLGKMLEACKLNLGDVAIVNIANNQITFTDIKSELQSSTVILLGTEPFSIQLPLNFPQFNQQLYADTIFLYTPAPDQMNQSTNEAKLLKSKLWVCLQKLFKL